MPIINVANGEAVSRLIREFMGDQHCLCEVLFFFGKHPRAHFSRLAIIHALDSYHLNIEKALKYLIEKQVVIVDAEGPCYSLNGDEPWHSQVSELVRHYRWRWPLSIGQA